MAISIKQIANEYTDQITRKQSNILKKAGEEAMFKIRTSIVQEWFGGFNSTSMIGSQDYRSRSVRVGDNHHRIIIESWVDPNRYSDDQNIQDWNVRNDKGYSQMELIEYVLNLQLEEGIIGLPQYGYYKDKNGNPTRKWINNYFYQTTPLRQVIENHSAWNNFETIVSKYI